MAETITYNDTQLFPDGDEPITIDAFISDICGVNETGKAKGACLFHFSSAQISAEKDDSLDFSFMEQTTSGNGIETLGLDGPILDLSVTTNPGCDGDYIILDIVFPPEERGNLKKAWTKFKAYLEKMNEFNMGGESVPLLHTLLVPNRSPQYLKQHDIYLMELINPIYVSLTGTDPQSPVNQISLFFDANYCTIYKNEEIDRTTSAEFVNMEIRNAIEREEMTQRERIRAQERAEKEYQARLSERLKQSSYQEESRHVLVGRAAEKREEENQE